MKYFIKPIGEKCGIIEYNNVDEARKFAEKNLESYKDGYEILDSKGEVTYKDEREEISRTDLIDWD